MHQATTCRVARCCSVRPVSRSSRPAAKATTAGVAPRVIRSPTAARQTGSEQRAPFTVGDADGLPFPDGAPDRLAIRLLAEDGATEVVAPADVVVHRDGVPVPYFPYRFTVEAPGTYFVEATTEGATMTAAVAVVASDGVAFPQAGSKMPSLQTPTTVDARGVDPICTLVPPCALHQRSLDEVVGAGKPAFVLVATPQFCHTAFCGPVLELMLAQLDGRDDIDAVHLEVYESGEAARTGTSDPAPAMLDLGLDFEPALFIVDAEGKVIDVLASIIDRAEFADAIALVS
jgi:hypothetical protein